MATVCQCVSVTLIYSFIVIIHVMYFDIEQVFYSYILLF